jgi:hypothetical protein
VRIGGLRTIVTVLAVAGFALSACGDDGGGGPSLSPTTTSPGTGSTGGTTTPPAVTTTVAAGPPTVVPTTPPDTNLGTPKLSDRSTVSTAGLDVVTFGMTIAQAEKAAGTRLLPDASFPAGPQCAVLKPEKGPDGVWFTVSKGTIERVDVRAPGKVKTRSGAGVGSTEAQIQSLFAGKITAADIAGGKALTYTPTDAANVNFRVIFETTGSAVSSYRSGRLPQITPTAPC